ncbi:MAG: hypothetical protein V3V00_15895 [Saprospiraceae bacterium]
MKKIIKYSDGDADLSFVYRKKLHKSVYYTNKKSDVNKNLKLSEITLDPNKTSMASKRGGNVVVTHKDWMQNIQFLFTEEYEIGSFRTSEQDVDQFVLYAERLLKIDTVKDLLDTLEDGE